MAEYNNSYQVRHGTHLAIADLVRVGMSGDKAAAERLGRRLMNEPPTGIRDTAAFTAAVDLAIRNSSSPARGLQRSFRDGTSAGTVSLQVPAPSAQRLEFNGKMGDHLTMLIRERAAREELRVAGLAPVSKVLLSGPPGVGKTMSAHWLAGHLGLPLIVVDLAQTMSSFLGESGRNIKGAFSEAEATECVFLIDEFDALAKRRDDSSDIGELKRLVNVLLLELDAWTGRSLLVAATNHSQLLDPAVQRRFDLAVEIPLPDAQEIEAMLSGVFGREAPDAQITKITADALLGTSNSDVVRFCRAVYRHSIVEARPLRQVLLERLLEMHAGDRVAQGEMWRQLKDDYGMSSRAIAEHASLSHPTVNAGIQRARGQRDGGFVER
ncbi:ATP-binding protein [Cryobacterium sp. GrIS_2_6]|uniref:AAA family ATPase n=1 Tax=Cryobacterium sp. GrIS_2_6 TaxID=3162785 RepID=UPI002E154611